MKIIPITILFLIAVNAKPLHRSKKHIHLEHKLHHLNEHHTPNQSNVKSQAVHKPTIVLTFFSNEKLEKNRSDPVYFDPFQRILQFFISSFIRDLTEPKFPFEDNRIATADKGYVCPKCAAAKRQSRDDKILSLFPESSSFQSKNLNYSHVVKKERLLRKQDFLLPEANINSIKTKRSARKQASHDLVQANSDASKGVTTMNLSAPEVTSYNLPMSNFASNSTNSGGALLSLSNFGNETSVSSIDELMNLSNFGNVTSINTDAPLTLSNAENAARVTSGGALPSLNNYGNETSISHLDSVTSIHSAPSSNLENATSVTSRDALNFNHFGNATSEKSGSTSPSFGLQNQIQIVSQATQDVTTNARADSTGNQSFNLQTPTDASLQPSLIGVAGLNKNAAVLNKSVVQLSSKQPEGELRDSIIYDFELPQRTIPVHVILQNETEIQYIPNYGPQVETVSNKNHDGIRNNVNSGPTDTSVSVELPNQTILANSDVVRKIPRNETIAIDSGPEKSALIGVQQNFTGNPIGPSLSMVKEGQGIIVRNLTQTSLKTKQKKARGLNLDGIVVNVTKSLHSSLIGSQNQSDIVTTSKKHKEKQAEINTGDLNPENRGMLSSDLRRQIGILMNSNQNDTKLFRSPEESSKNLQTDEGLGVNVAGKYSVSISGDTDTEATEGMEFVKPSKRLNHYFLSISGDTDKSVAAPLKSDEELISVVHTSNIVKSVVAGFERFRDDMGGKAHKGWLIEEQKTNLKQEDKKGQKKDKDKDKDKNKKNDDKKDDKKDDTKNNQGSSSVKPDEEEPEDYWEPPQDDDAEEAPTLKHSNKSYFMTISIPIATVVGVIMLALCFFLRSNGFCCRLFLTDPTIVEVKR